MAARGCESLQGQFPGRGQQEGTHGFATHPITKECDDIRESADDD
jgi:hypothetical protein